MTPTADIRVKPGRDKKLRGFYPWVQREEVMRVIGTPEPGDLVRVLDHKGVFVGIGTYSPSSRFPIRLLTQKEEPIDEAFFARAFEHAIARRAHLKGTNALRIVFGEADAVPGLIVDRYDQWLAVQVRSQGMERLKAQWLPALRSVTGAKGMVERSDMEGRREEGLEPFAGPLDGTVPDHIEIEEHGLRYQVPSLTGLKTGFYLDQRDNRALLGQLVQPGDRVLDCFCYSGGFALNAARSGAEVIGVDLSEEAIGLARMNASHNGLRADFRVANAFEFLEQTDEGEFDWIILDPPAIAKNKGSRDSLKWGIWKLTVNALPRLKVGGRLAVFSCAYQFDLVGMQETVRLAANDKGIRLAADRITLQPEDHPYLLQFPESLYLKGLWVRRMA